MMLLCSQWQHWRVGACWVTWLHDSAVLCQTFVGIHFRCVGAVIDFIVTLFCLSETWRKMIVQIQTF
jgi:hypothetical protein